MSILKKINRRIVGFIYHKTGMYRYDQSKYDDSFISKHTCELEPNTLAQKKVWVFWTGDNEMSPERSACYKSIVEKSGVDVVLITPKNLSDYVIDEHPLHPMYEKLSFVHRSDYLRCYFMHHHGGGYFDIKNIEDSISDLFDELNESDSWFIGYREINEHGVPEISGEIGYDIKTHYRYIIGNGGYIFKPRSSFTQEWYDELHNRLDGLSEQLINAETTVRTSENYPVEWSFILAQIFQPLCLKYHNKLLQSDKMKPSFKNYM